VRSEQGCHSRGWSWRCAWLATIALNQSSSSRKASGMANAMSSFDVGGDAVRVVDKAVGVNYAAHGRGLGAARLCPSLQNCGESAIALDDSAFADISKSTLYRRAAFAAARIFGHRSAHQSARPVLRQPCRQPWSLREVYHGLGTRQPVGRNWRKLSA
jgi:hypothetical protein